MLNRAWSTLEIKSVDRSQRVIEGIASTPDVDRGGDSLDPAGAEFSLPMPFLWKHGDPIGEVFAVTVKPDGIHIKARISTVAADAPAKLRDLVETAWHSITANPPLVRGLSVGWSPLEMVKSAGPYKRFSRWIWGETSAVTVPMNARATITSVKSADQPVPAATGTGRAVSSIPGATGKSRATAMNVSELLTTEQETLQTKSERLEELMTDESTNGTLEAAEATELTALTKEVEALTAKVARLKTLEAAQLSQATPVTMQVAGARQPARPALQFKTVDLPKGTIFIRYAMAVAAGKGSYSDTVAYAKRWEGQTPEVLRFIKAQEGTAFGSSPSWGTELVNPNTAATEFVELLNPMTIIGRVPGFRRVPFNIPIITQIGGSTFDWVGEAGVKPVGELAFERTTMPTSKVAGIVVMTEELVRLSTPSAEATVRQDLLEQCAKFLDEQFIQVAIGAGANNPASITNNVSSPSATGTDVGALLADLNAALATFDNANIPSDGLVIVMTPALARGISLLLTSLGQRAFPEMTPSGGTLLGYPVIVSASVDSGTLVIFKPSEIFLSDDGRVTLDASNQATLDMSGGSPTAPTFNLWQRNCVGLRAERWIRWQKRRSDVVAVIDNAAYGPSVGSP